LDAVNYAKQIPCDGHEIAGLLDGIPRLHRLRF
jgi:hypothetical protein